MSEKQEMLAKALLGMQNALLGAIESSLRAVVVDVNIEKKELYFSFFYDGQVSDKLFDLASIACCEASSYFPDYFVHERIERLDYPIKISVEGRYAYLRKE